MSTWDVIHRCSFSTLWPKTSSSQCGQIRCNKEAFLARSFCGHFLLQQSNQGTPLLDYSFQTAGIVHNPFLTFESRISLDQASGHFPFVLISTNIVLPGLFSAVWGPPHIIFCFSYLMLSFSCPKKKYSLITSSMKHK